MALPPCNMTLSPCQEGPISPFLSLALTPCLTGFSQRLFPTSGQRPAGSGTHGRQILPAARRRWGDLSMGQRRRRRRRPRAAGGSSSSPDRPQSAHVPPPRWRRLFGSYHHEKLRADKSGGAPIRATHALGYPLVSFILPGRRPPHSAFPPANHDFLSHPISGNLITGQPYPIPDFIQHPRGLAAVLEWHPCKDRRGGPPNRVLK